ncbi:uncharacterized protein LOC143818193 [Ranitomeya variabilis]|uniref:uncharacterized protein LOC143818193 n=1 Tax=Ranitomeya variabilis TaxID=490064 RepID=UPI004055D0BF
MDLKARESAWRSKAVDIFEQSVPVVSHDAPHEIKDGIFQYRNVLQRKIRLWWNKTTLENYHTKKIVPRGLRVQLFPTYDLGDPELVKRWISAASTCSLEFIQILIDNNATSLEEVDKKLEDLQKSLQKEMQKEQFEKLLREFDTDITKWEDNVSKEKLKKFQRDVTDYDLNKIFRWQNPKKKLQSMIRKREESITPSTSDIDSNASASESEPARDFQLCSGSQKRRFPDMFNKNQKGKRIKDRYQVVNLSQHNLSVTQINVLERGLTFSPSCSLDIFTCIKDTHLFARKLIFKKLHAKNLMSDQQITKDEQEALEALISLEEENAALETELIDIMEKAFDQNIISKVFWITSKNVNQNCLLFI